MPTLSGPYGTGAFFILISALLHLLTPLFGGLSPAVMLLVPVGLVYLAIVAGLTRGWRSLAYVAFFVMSIGGISALGWLWTSAPIPGWWMLIIAIADGLATLTLFGALWRVAPDARP